MRAVDRGEGAVEDKYFVRSEKVLEAFAGLPRIDHRRFREDIDAYANQDPTPRFWPEES